jgi:hypothetical protein
MLLEKVYWRSVVVVLALSASGIGAELLPGDAVRLIATYLQQSQTSDGPDCGLWPGEELFMGSITAGMTCAYESTDDSTFLLAARFGASHLLDRANANGYLLGDEAYALVKMSQVRQQEASPNPGVYDEWLDSLKAFYGSLSGNHSTLEYVGLFDGLEASNNVFYFAHYAVAAYYVDDPDKEIWRDALIAELSRVQDDEFSCPVTALGVATWALAQTGDLDDTPVAGARDPSPYWDGMTLRDLPRLLLSHQVPPGEQFAGSFYWRFDHTSGDRPGMVSGFTEDVAYGALGLAAAGSLQDNLNKQDLRLGVLLAQEALLQGIDAEGTVYEHLCCQGETRYVFGGELLQALWGIEQYLEAEADPETAGAASSVEGQN